MTTVAPSLNSDNSEGADVKVRYPYTRSYRDRHGKLRVEYRRNGKTIPLPTAMGTAQFQAAYDAAKAKMAGGQHPTVPALTSAKPRVDTLRWLCAEYFKSAEFGQLGGQPRKKNGGDILNTCYANPLSQGPHSYSVITLRPRLK